MTYQPERDGFSVARTSADGTTSVQDDRPVVVEDDGTARRVQDARPASDAHLVDDTRTDGMAAHDDRMDGTHTDGMATHDDRMDGTRTDGGLVADDNRTQGLVADDGRHTRVMDAEDAHTVVAADPRAVRGQRVDTMAMPMAPEAVTARERAAYGGIKWGSAFFGWLSAMGLAVILTGLVAGAGTALGLANDVSGSEVVGDVASGNGNGTTIGIAGAIAVLLIILVSYYAGGYVAGRMARFDGARQGFAVWVWSVVIAVVVALIAVIAGNQYDVLGNLNAVPRFPVDASSLSTAGLIALVATVIVALIGAILGGLAGMGFHRKVDAAAFDPTNERIAA